MPAPPLDNRGEPAGEDPSFVRRPATFGLDEIGGELPTNGRVEDGEVSVRPGDQPSLTGQAEQLRWPGPP